MKVDDVPRFGVLQGVNVVCIGVNLAGPLAAGLLAELGANVIHVENARMPDTLHRSGDGLVWAVEHRNQRNIAIDITSELGREAFLKLLRWADIWVESSKGGNRDKHGLSDEDVWKVNPRLVVAHLSGYGREGLPDFVERAGYDGAAQAFSGYMFWNGFEAEPLRVKPYLGDYVPPLMLAFAAVSAYVRAKDTGVGESIDLAQYEALVRLQGLYLLDALNEESVRPRSGNREAKWEVYDVFRCADNGSLLVLITGVSSWKAARSLLGFDEDSDFDNVLNLAPKPGAAADKAHAGVARFCAERTLDEAETAFNTAGIAASRVMGPQDMREHPHYLARETLTSWHDHVGDREIWGPNVVPKFKKNPARIWRSGPATSEDALDILEELGYSHEETAHLVEAEVVLAPTGASARPLIAVSNPTDSPTK